MVCTLCPVKIIKYTYPNFSLNFCTFYKFSYLWSQLNRRLLLYPHGNKKRNGDGCISLYLQIAETETLPLGWQINVNFKLFVFDQIQDKYLTIEGVVLIEKCTYILLLCHYCNC